MHQRLPLARIDDVALPAILILKDDKACVLIGWDVDASTKARSARVLHEFGDGSEPFKLSVNLSTRDLLDTELPEKLERLMQRHGARAEGFCLEITESAIMDDPQRAQATLQTLRERGYGLSIDDFGTGYSSLAYLKRLPVGELKIDRSFVMAMHESRQNQEIVRAMLTLGRTLGHKVIAEGVETAAQGEFLAAQGCDELQGYLVSPALPLVQFEAWVMERRSRREAAGGGALR